MTNMFSMSLNTFVYLIYVVNDELEFRCTFLLLSSFEIFPY